MTKLPTYRMTDLATRYVAAHRRKINQFSPCHWHDCCEVELVLSGSGSHIINGTAHPLQPGDLYMFTPADNHSLKLDSPMEVLGIMFEENRLDSEIFSHILALEASGETLLAHLEPDELPTIRNYFEAILREESGNERLLSEIYIGRLLDCIAVELLHKLSRRTELPVNAPVREAILWLYRHYTEPVRLTDAADMLHLNRSYFSELFTKETGQTFRGYLINLRLSAACRLLTGTRRTVTDICYDCGFESYSHFMRTFKEHFHVSPLTFRRQHTAQ